jgi:hypothetical protein
MIQILNSGVSVEALLNLIWRLQAFREEILPTSVDHVAQPSRSIVASEDNRGVPRSQEKLKS